MFNSSNEIKYILLYFLKVLVKFLVIVFVNDTSEKANSQTDIGLSGGRTSLAVLIKVWYSCCSPSIMLRFLLKFG